MSSSLSLDTLKPNLLPIAAAVVVIAAVPLAIMPWTAQAMESFEKMGQQTELRDQLKAKADKLESFDSAASQALLEDVVEPALPAQHDPAGVLGTLEIVAQATEVRTDGVTYANQAASRDSSTATTPSATETVGTVEVSYTVTGGYENIVNFIARSERITRVLNLSSLHISKNDSELPEVTATLEVSSPYLPHPTNLGPVSDPFPELTSKETTVVDTIRAYNQATYSPTELQTITGKSNPFQ